MPRPRRGYAGKRGYAPPRKGRGRRPPGDEEEEDFRPPPKSKGPVFIMVGFTLLAVGLVTAALAISNSRSNEPRSPEFSDGPRALPGEGGEAKFCPSCRGTGKFDCPDCETALTNCSSCGGFGYLQCAACMGTGR